MARHDYRFGVLEWCSKEVLNDARGKWRLERSSYWRHWVVLASVMTIEVFLGRLRVLVAEMRLYYDCIMFSFIQVSVSLEGSNIGD